MQSDRRKRISVFAGDLTTRRCRQLFDTYEFRQVVFVSHSASPFTSVNGAELDHLAAVLSACRQDTRVVYITGPRHGESDPISVAESAAMALCRHHAPHTAGITTLICPWIYSAEVCQSAMAPLFSPGKQEIPVTRDQVFSFLSADDLAVLLFRMFEGHEPPPEVCTVPGTDRFSAEAFAALIPGKLQLRCTGSHTFPIPEAGDDLLREKYLWFPVCSIADDLEEMAARFRPPRPGILKSLWAFLKKPRFLIRFAELLTAFVFTQLILRASGASVQFRFIDFRLLFIVIMGTLYDMPMGIAAAALASLSLVHGYTMEGTGWMNLFYEPTNWLPFIAYFTVGAVCGYIRSRDRNLLQFAREETGSAAQRYHYLQQITGDILEEKQAYKQQILRSRDSFGKIFCITRQLNHAQPEKVLAAALEILEKAFPGAGAAIFPDPGVLPDAVPELIQPETVWVNREMDPNLPGFLYGIYRGERIAAVIALRNPSLRQMNLYHENLFRILCGLTSDALIRAMDSQAVQEKKAEAIP